MCGNARRKHEIDLPGRRAAAQGRCAATGDPQQRQLFQHRHRRAGRDPDLQRRFRAHAGLQRRRGGQSDHAGRHLRRGGNGGAGQVAEPGIRHHHPAGLRDAGVQGHARYRGYLRHHLYLQGWQPAAGHRLRQRAARRRRQGHRLSADGTDNTARKRVEEEQAQLDQRLREQQLALVETNLQLETARAIADKANRAKSEFLSSMSHELRTPLNAVLGFAQLLASDKPPPTQSQQRSLDQILKGGWYLLQLINEILDLAMIESGQVMMSQESMGLSEVLRDCQAMMEPQANKRGIDMRFTSLEQPFFVHSDRTRVKQVLINLLSNAIKYNRKGGSVTVTAGTSS